MSASHEERDLSAEFESLRQDTELDQFKRSVIESVEKQIAKLDSNYEYPNYSDPCVIEILRTVLSDCGLDDR